MPTTRRFFVGATGAVSTLFLASLGLARKRPETPQPLPTPTPEPGKAPEGLARLARERYGKFLTEKQLPMLDREMASIEQRSSRLRAFKLKNWEESATDFRVRR